MKKKPLGIVIVFGRLQIYELPQGRIYGSSVFSTPFTTGCPSLIDSVSPPPATTRLMKFWLDSTGVAFGQGSFSGTDTPHSAADSAPSGGWKTTMLPIFGSCRWYTKRLTRTRWPTSKVGSIEPEGIWYGFTRNAWIASASPRASATITTNSITPPALPFGLGSESFSPRSPRRSRRLWPASRPRAHLLRSLRHLPQPRSASRRRAPHPSSSPPRPRSSPPRRPRPRSGRPPPGSRPRRPPRPTRRLPRSLFYRR